MKNEMIIKLIEKLSKQRDDAFYEFKEIKYTDFNWVQAEMNYNKIVNDIDIRIDNLMMQIV